MKEVIMHIISDRLVNFIQIYDYDDNIIFEDYVSNICMFNGNKNTYYKVRIISGKFILNTSIYISDKYTDPYIFNMVNNNKSHKILINMTDFNYSGLKIERGNIILWQSHIT